MQYNDGNKTRQREEERESLRVLSSDNCNIRKRDIERSTICIHLADQNKVTVRLKAESGAKKCHDFLDFFFLWGGLLTYLIYFSNSIITSG